MGLLGFSLGGLGLPSSSNTSPASANDSGTKLLNTPVIVNVGGGGGLEGLQKLVAAVNSPMGDAAGWAAGSPASSASLASSPLLILVGGGLLLWFLLRKK